MLIINIKIDMNIKHICFIALLIAVCQTQQDSTVTPQSQDFVSIERKIESQEIKEEKDVKKRLPPYVLQELKSAKEQKENFKGTESFIVALRSSEMFEFRYKIQSNPNPTVMIRVFTQESQDDIAFIKNHQEDAYLEVLSCTTLFGTYHQAGKAYMHKVIKLGSHSGSQLFVRLHNKFNMQIIVEVALSGPPLEVDRFNAIKNSQFSIVAKKLEAIQNEMKQVQALNKDSFKVEWGFLEREQHYEQEMLKLTGFEALVILATAMVQIYCIKSLIDKNIVI